MIAALYCRKSTDQHGVSDEQKSVARQIEHATAYAQRKGWTVGDEHVYVDDGISGAEFANRHGFLRLMNSLKPRPSFQVLVMSEESRLGREAIETAYTLKQLVQAGVRVFFYLEDRERTLDSPTDKIMLSLTAFADELEREKARQRTYDAMIRKARAGHVTGGACFGYRNLEIVGADGRRSHVEREIEPVQADTIRQIFRLCADGYGVKAIAKLLNEQGSPSPRAQRGRSHSWAPSSVRAVLFRAVYRGEIIWAQTRKRDKWGRKQQHVRSEHEWIRVPAPTLRIVTETGWQTAHARLTAARALYVRANRGETFGRPAVGSPSRYLLTNVALCGCCGHALTARTRAHGTGRKHFYGCAAYHDRGRTVCQNKADVPMPDADDIVLEALLDDVIDPTIVSDAIDEALNLLRGDRPSEHLDRIHEELDIIERERVCLANAIAAGGELDGLLDALRTRDQRRARLEAQRAMLFAQAPLQAADAGRVRRELTDLARSWRQVLVAGAQHARPIVTALLVGRVTITPALDAARTWILRGEGTLRGLFERVILPVGMASPTGAGRLWYWDIARRVSLAA